MILKEGKKILTLVTLAFIGLSTANAQVGIGTNDPDASAILEVDVTSLTEKKGFLPPRMTEAERDNISSPATGLTIYNTDINCLEYYGGYGWTDFCTVLEAGDVLNPQTGRIWMDRNLGASQVATSPTDAASYGHLYQWGRGTDGHQLRSLDCTTSDCFDALVNDDNLPLTAANVTNATWDGKFIYNIEFSGSGDWHQDNPDNNLWQGVNGTNNPCPSGYRVPTEAEWQTENSSWSSNDSAGAIGSPLKLPLAGSRSEVTGNFSNVDSGGRYWSSTVSGNDAERLIITSSSSFFSEGNRALGYSVRCIKE